MAALIDSLSLLAVILPLLLWVYGWQYLEPGSAIRGPMDLLISWVLPCLAAVACWRYRSATPGKMIVSAWIVDQRSGRQPSLAQCIIRYFAYVVSAVPLGLGFLWIAFDPRKQAWHDKLSGTVVTRGRPAAIPAARAESALSAAAQPEPAGNRSPWSDEPFDLSDPATAWPEPAVAQATSRYSFPGVAVPEAVVVESSGP